jgi:transposase
MMELDKVKVREVLKNAKELMGKSKDLSPELVAVFSLLVTMMEILLTLIKIPKNSRNSSIPPSMDINRAKNLASDKDQIESTSESKAPDKKKKKPGGQKGREGKNLKPFENPDKIIPILVEREDLPKGHEYKAAGFVARQVVDMEISRIVTEYRLEVLEDEKGKKYTAKAPIDASRPVQYGRSIKVAAVYMSMFQMIPIKRVEDYFVHQAGIPVCAGSLVNFNAQAFDLLEEFEKIAIKKLQNAGVLHADETGINVNGKRIWLHGAGNDLWTLFNPSQVRGKDAMDAMGILPEFKGVLVHDHWKSYFSYTGCLHALCNAHHLRELQNAMENCPSQTWSRHMKEFLIDLNKTVTDAGGVLPPKEDEKWRKAYRKILKKGEKECPNPEIPKKGEPKKRGRPPKTKERNLLERLRDFEDEVLRFMTQKDVGFTNNQGERDLRMTKVQQKISGCFKSIEGAKVFCRVRSYILTCQKQGITPSDALNMLFQQKLPEFCLS